MNDFDEFLLTVVCLVHSVEIVFIGDEMCHCTTISFFLKKEKDFFVQKKIVKDCSEEHRWRDNGNITRYVHNNRYNHSQHERRRISFPFRQTSFSPCEEQMTPENKQIIPILTVHPMWRRWFLTSSFPWKTFFRFGERPFWRENLLTKDFSFSLLSSLFHTITFLQHTFSLHHMRITRMTRSCDFGRQEMLFFNMREII